MRVRSWVLALGAAAATAVSVAPVAAAAAPDCAGLPKHGNLPVVDAANVVDAEAEAFLVSDLLTYRIRGRQAIVAATVPNLGGDDVASYAQRLFDCWGIGDAEADNGMLVLVAMREQKIRIELGAGLDGVLDEGQLDAALDEMVAPLRSGEVGSALRAAAVSLVHDLGGQLPDAEHGKAGRYPKTAAGAHARPSATASTHPGDVSDPGTEPDSEPVLPSFNPFDGPYTDHGSPFASDGDSGTGFATMVPLFIVFGVVITVVKAIFRGGFSGGGGSTWRGGFPGSGAGNWNSASLLHGGAWHDRGGLSSRADDDDDGGSFGGSSGSSGGSSSGSSGGSFGGGSSGGGGASGSW